MGSKATNHSVWSDKQVFTTGEAAKVCKVSQQTIIRCFDSGRLHGFRVPGSRFRRIPRAELLRFMHANDIPTESIEGPTRMRVLIVEDDDTIAALLIEALSNNGRYDVKTASCGYDAGILTEKLRPHLIILDHMLPDLSGHLVCKRIRSNPELKDTKIIIISGTSNPIEIENIKRAGSDAFVKKPFDISELLEKVADVLEA